VTGFAVVAEAAGVGVIATMAGPTAAADFGFVPAGAGVTVVAGQRNMGASQREISVSIVIESPGTPGRWIVATAALAAEATVVWIILFMAIDTGIAGVSIRR
jgi:hypothetical protein